MRILLLAAALAAAPLFPAIPRAAPIAIGPGPALGTDRAGVTWFEEFQDWSASDLKALDQAGPSDPTYSFGDGFEASRDLAALYFRAEGDALYFRVDVLDLALGGDLRARCLRRHRRRGRRPNHRWGISPRPFGRYRRVLDHVGERFRASNEMRKPVRRFLRELPELQEDIEHFSPGACPVGPWGGHVVLADRCVPELWRDGAGIVAPLNRKDKCLLRAARRKPVDWWRGGARIRDRVFTTWFGSCFRLVLILRHLSMAVGRMTRV